MNKGNQHIQKAFNDICKRHRKKKFMPGQATNKGSKASLLLLVRASLQKERQN